jgi:hypothetical protein
MNRLFAALLALLIGNPVCWCCMAHASEAADDEPEVSCCHQTEKDQTPPLSSKDSCSCELMECDRESSPIKVALPAVDLVWMNLPEWQVVQITPALSEVPVRLMITQDTGPPSAPLYQQHCVWRL